MNTYLPYLIKIWGGGALIFLDGAVIDVAIILAKVRTRTDLMKWKLQEGESEQYNGGPEREKSLGRWFAYGDRNFSVISKINDHDIACSIYFNIFPAFPPGKLGERKFA